MMENTVRFFNKEIDPAQANCRYDTPFLEKGETLVCFGDSLTAANPGYMGYLTEFLDGKGIHVINAGRSGDKTPWALTRLEKDVMDRKPDAVSVFLGTNDAAVGRNLWANEPVVSPHTYKENLIWIIHLCRTFGGIKKFSICTPSGRWEGKACMQYGENNAPYCCMAREASDAADARLVPWDAVFNDYWRRYGSKASPEGLLLTRDGIHLSPDGYRLLAETMLRAWGMMK